MIDLVGIIALLAPVGLFLVCWVALRLAWRHDAPMARAAVPPAVAPARPAEPAADERRVA